MLRHKLQSMHCTLVLSSVTVTSDTSSGDSTTGNSLSSSDPSFFGQSAAASGRAAARRADKREEAEVEKDEAEAWVFMGSRQSQNIAYWILALVLVVLMAMRICPGVANVLNKLLDFLGAGSSGTNTAASGHPQPNMGGGGGMVGNGSNGLDPSIVLPQGGYGGGQYATIMPHAHTVNDGRRQYQQAGTPQYKFGVNVEDLDGVFFEDGRQERPPGESMRVDIYSVYK
jgi:hypothetical protein